MSGTFGQLLSTLFKKKKRVRTDENVGANDKKGFIQLNGLSSGYKGIRKFLKAIYCLCMVVLILLTLGKLEEVK